MNNEQLLKNAMKYSQEFLDFLHSAYSVFHVSEYAKNMLERIGYTRLKETDSWNLKKGGKYFFQRNNTAIVAFQIGSNFDEQNTGFKIFGAHLDSPCLQLAPISKLQQYGFNQACVQIYGGGLWHTWFDRDLNIGGKIIYYNDKTQQYESKLWNSKKPLMKVANLAIHQLTAEERVRFPVNTENQLRPIISTDVVEQIASKITKQNKNTSNDLPQCTDKHYDKLMNMIAEDLKIDKKSIFDLELQLSDATKGIFTGIYDEFISSGKIDDLICAFAGLKAMENTSPSNKKYIDMIVLFDHEEVGSNSTHGAKSTLIPDTISRIMSLLAKDTKDDLLRRAIGNSFMISSDVTHSVHPNYQDRAQINHQSKINQGLNIKYDPGQNYASSCATRSIIYEICKKINVPILDQIKANNIGSGSTIGPTISAMSSIRTVDVGPAIFGMHSIRETAGILDAYYEFLLCKGLFDEFEKLGQEQKNEKVLYKNSVENESQETWEIIEQL